MKVSDSLLLGSQPRRSRQWNVGPMPGVTDNGRMFWFM